ncbi:uncharacterized protein BO72DRAFT_451822 [Aspergillus fijiensis CBS 313.89]|uniref:Uncharacterized protein n=1 Tax=Aspergillus fijiensis CBS 313.89 TaxID=1448319 RepID=A0A8G1VUV3_9EURO|nr:uncharacterized protein BO72DRAFT_451822 [Aspergillus fijiensis CBS 313.89]RAK73442.1 hypothetical protein BO72DRAFT_451822 [Aspergillus fijiensis CBS 313.89]
MERDQIKEVESSNLERRLLVLYAWVNRMAKSEVIVHWDFSKLTIVTGVTELPGEDRGRPALCSGRCLWTNQRYTLMFGHLIGMNVCLDSAMYLAGCTFMNGYRLAWTRQASLNGLAPLAVYHVARRLSIRNGQHGYGRTGRCEHRGTDQKRANHECTTRPI